VGPGGYPKIKNRRSERRGAGIRVRLKRESRPGGGNLSTNRTKREKGASQPNGERNIAAGCSGGGVQRKKSSKQIVRVFLLPEEGKGKKSSKEAGQGAFITR